MKNSNIQWCHSTINPVMGCEQECELANKDTTVAQLIKAMAQLFPGINKSNLVEQVKYQTDSRYLSEIYRDREAIAEALVSAHPVGPAKAACQALVDVVRERSKCYALILGTNRAGRKGYADKFEEPELFPGRMAEAASWGPPTPMEREAKPWLGGTRLIFVSDMGDALSPDVPFDYLRTEVIDNVSSFKGQRHTWLWLTKQPGRMALFGSWLTDRGIVWPDNLVAMTTVTSSNTLGRIHQLLKVPSRHKGLSVEPLFEPVKLPLAGIDWVVVGGGSDALAEPFQVEWALDIREQCRKAGCSFFLKQLGRHPWYKDRSLELHDRHGGDWREWPAGWRVREVPTGFYRQNPTGDEVTP